MRKAVKAVHNDVMVPALTNGELDLIFNVLPDSPYAGCVQERLFDDVFVVCSAPDHPLAKRKRLAMADLADELWTLSVPSVLNVQYLHRMLQASGLPPPRVAIEARPLRLRLQICASTRLLSFNARRSLELAAPRLRVKELPVEHLKWRRAFGVIYRKDSYLSPAALDDGAGVVAAVKSLKSSDSRPVWHARERPSVAANRIGNDCNGVVLGPMRTTAP